jgi:epsilon-lactone hydrolase
MSLRPLDPIVQKVVDTFNQWGPDTPIATLRKEWDEVFSDVVPVVGAQSQAVDAGGVKAEWISAPDARKDAAILYLHGGGYILGSINSHRDVCERLSRAAKARVLAIDYRLAPEHAFPAAIDDAVAAYRWLVKQGISPKRLAIAGDSAGGGLSMATLVALKRAGDALPACATLMSPWVDLELTGDSMTTKDAEDPMVHRPMVANMAAAYVQSGDVGNPLASPLKADLAGLPPLMIHVGTRETLLDDSVRLAAAAKKAGVAAEFKAWEGHVHVFQIFASGVADGETSLQELGAFIRKHIP